jgi:membrane protein YqaA with SNARE-associated domain
MIEWLLATAGAALLGSVVPVVNIELYLIGVLSTVHGLPWWLLGLAATVGQITGKCLFFFAGRGSFTLGERLSRMTKAKQGSRWAEWMERFHEKAQRRPLWGLAVLFIGAITGIPPYTVMCFVTGAAGIPFLGFLAVSFVGRLIHFLLVAGAPELVRHLPSAFG